MDAMRDRADDFEEHREHLRRVAYRLLGSHHDAEDAVQEAWIRFERVDRGPIGDLRAWLTTVVSRVSLDLLRGRAARREHASGDAPAEALPGAVIAGSPEGAGDPAARAELAESVSVALHVVLESLGPAERVSFVLHDLFAVPFELIASVLETSPVAARQLASRARRRVQGDGAGVPSSRRHVSAGQREIVDAFLDAATGGDLERLVKLLHPAAVLRSDGAAAAMGSPALIGSGHDVAGFFCGRAKAARRVLIDGAPAALWSLRGVPQVAFLFTLDDLTARILRIDLIGDPDRLAGFTIDSMRRATGVE